MAVMSIILALVPLTRVTIRPREAIPMAQVTIQVRVLREARLLIARLHTTTVRHQEASRITARLTGATQRREANLTALQPGPIANHRTVLLQEVTVHRPAVEGAAVEVQVVLREDQDNLRLS